MSHLAPFPPAKGSLRGAKSDPLDGGKTWRRHLAPPLPVEDFWSVILYRNPTRSMIETTARFPCVSSQDKEWQVNADGAVDV